MTAEGRPIRRIAGVTAAVTALTLGFGIAAGAQEAAAIGPRRPRILVNQSPRAIEYQLRLLSNDELAAVDRDPADARYRLVYYALLTRTGIAPQYRDEAMSVLVALDGASRPRVWLEALGRVPATDEIAGQRLLRLLLDESDDALRRDRDAFMRAADADESAGMARRGAYAALLQADGEVDPLWSSAAPSPVRLRELLRAVPPVIDGRRGRDLQPQFARSIVGLLSGELDAGVRAAAVSALGVVARDRGALDRLVLELTGAGDDAVRAAAIRSLQRVPTTLWSEEAAEIVVEALLAIVGNTAPSRRTDPGVIDAIQLGAHVSVALPDTRGRAVRREFAALGVQVVRLETVPEQMRFNRAWFVVEAGKRVQIVLFNADAMPHNVVVGRPGSLEQIGTAAAVMPMPADPAAKPYVPNSPLVLASTRLVWEGETERLNFIAPRQPGEYVFACTYPGHWARMYGVMLVVDSLEDWENAKVPPHDPLTNALLQ